MTQMNTDYHDDLIMKKIFAFFASLREIIEFFQWTQLFKTTGEKLGLKETIPTSQEGTG